MFKISPSILACDFSNIGLEIKKIENAGADFVHMDVMDGHFVPNISFGSNIIKAAKKGTSLPFDVHLMISKPYDYIENFVDAGADIITFHLESNSDTLKTIEKIKSFGKKAGLSIKPNTPVSKLYPFLEYINLALVMTVEPGFGGQKFMLSQMEKTNLLKQKIINKNLSTIIEIDGGVNLETINYIKKFPVDVLVSGTCIFNSTNPKKVIQTLKCL